MAVAGAERSSIHTYLALAVDGRVGCPEVCFGRHGLLAGRIVVDVRSVLAQAGDVSRPSFLEQLVFGLDRRVRSFLSELVTDSLSAGDSSLLR